MATPAEQPNGTDLHWGVASAGVTAITNATGVDYSLESEYAEAKGSDGEAVAYCHYNPSKKVTVVGYTTAVAGPAIGAKVTLTNALTDIAGDYSCAACRIRESNTDFTVFEVDLVQINAIAVT